MTFYHEDRTVAQHYQAQRDLEQLLKQLEAGKTKVRIVEYARRHRRSVGVFLAYHAEKDFPFEVSVDGQQDYFALGQFVLVSESEGV